jgi:hypothetical protein
MPELSKLRVGQPERLLNTVLPADSFRRLQTVGLQLEIDAYFQLNTSAPESEFGIAVRVSSDGHLQTRFGVRLAPPVGPLNNTDMTGA